MTTQPTQPGQNRQAEWVGVPPKGWDKPLNRRTGLVLSGGGLKFAVHAGIYERMETLPYFEGENQGRVQALSEAFDCTVGTSAGSLLAASIACGYCAEDVSRFARLFSKPAFMPYILDPNWLGLGSFLLSGDLRYLKGIYQGEAIQRTVEVFFSHNLMRELGRLYREFTARRQPTDGDDFDNALALVVRRLHSLPREELPQSLPVEKTKESAVANTQTGEVLRFITFQDVNPGALVPFSLSPEEGQALAQSRYNLFAAHADDYRNTLQEYYGGRVAAGRPVIGSADTVRPLLFIIGTDLVTGQKTIFANYNLFEKKLIYDKNRAVQPSVSYYYINPMGYLDTLPDAITEELRPVNYLYKYLWAGLPVAWGVRASLSIPGVFTPSVIKYQDDQNVPRIDYFVDGGVTDNYALQVAADKYIGGCGRILGGNIGNLGPRVHDYNVGSVIQVLLKTLYIEGDVIVDSNADNNLVDTAAVTTINELTTTGDVGISELAKIPALLQEGRQLADQFFASFRDEKSGLVALERLFLQKDSYIVFLPRLELYGKPPGTPAPPLPPVPDDCRQLPSGSAEIDRIIESDKLTPAEKIRRSQVLGACETNLIPPPLLSPGGLLFGSLEGKPIRSFAMTDPLNLLRWLAALVGLSFFSLLSLGIWRAVVWLLERLNWAKTAVQHFDSWNFWLLLVATAVGVAWLYLLFFRALIFDFTLARSDKLTRRALEVPIGLVLFLAPIALIEVLGGGSEWWRTLLGLVLIPFSATALLFTVYVAVALIRTLLRRNTENKA